MREKALLIAFGLVVGLLLGYAAGLRVIKGYTAQESYKPEARQTDGSLVLERKPAPVAKPAQKIPNGTKVERVIQLDVEATKPITRVDLTVVADQDGGKRVVASSPDGKIIGGTDIPIGPSIKPLKWAAGGCYSPPDNKYGAFIQYQSNAFIIQATYLGNSTIVGMGVRF